jgi:hypothetical protein
MTSAGRAVSRHHLSGPDQDRLQMFVTLFESGGRWMMFAELLSARNSQE